MSATKQAFPPAASPADHCSRRLPASDASASEAAEKMSWLGPHQFLHEDLLVAVAFGDGFQNESGLPGKAKGTALLESTRNPAAA